MPYRGQSRLRAGDRWILLAARARERRSWVLQGQAGARQGAGVADLQAEQGLGPLAAQEHPQCRRLLVGKLPSLDR